jgi:indolepyruvate ferredoxin oxidoreductase alpha subunit
MVELEKLVRGIGVSDVQVVDAFNIKALRAAIRSSLDSPELSVVIVRGDCPVRVRRTSEPRTIDAESCNQCDVCLHIGCPSIQKEDGQININAVLCAGEACQLCEQLCPQRAIHPQSAIAAGGVL